MCCTRLAANTRRKNVAKNRHLVTIAQLHRAISSQLRHVSTIEKKKLVKQHTSSTCAYSMVNFGPLVAEILSLVWGTPAISRGFAFWIRYCSDVAQRKSTKLHDVWPSPGLVHYIYIGLVHYIYIFGISCPLTEFCHVQNSLCVQVMRSPILVALMHGSPAAGVSQTLRR